jgi:hypothetical protein
MAKAKMNGTQMAVLRAARGLDDATLKTIRAAIFAAAKTQFNIPQSHRLSVEIDSTDAADYGVLKRKTTGQTYDDGVPPPVTYRWFRCAAGTTTPVSSCFSDGYTSAPTGNGFTANNKDFVASSNGYLYVKLASTAFSR